MKRTLTFLWHSLALLGLATLVGAGWFASRGVGTRQDPPAVEISMARAARHALIPGAARTRANPLLPTGGSIRAGLEHWADHCASCHGNDGSGDTEIGRALYPRAPDMRLADTQNLTDGELFYIIENGVKLTGMPAWGTGTADGEQASWHLVTFIRRLPQLTDEELLAMEALNPRSPDQWRALEAERKFLAGETDVPPPAAGDKPAHSHKGGQP